MAEAISESVALTSTFRPFAIGAAFIMIQAHCRLAFEGEQATSGIKGRELCD